MARAHPGPPRSLPAALLAGVALATGCGADPAPSTVIVRGGGSDLLAIREGDAPWQALEVDADVEVEVEGPFTVAAVCDIAGFRDYYTVYAAPHDGEEVDLRCVPSAPATDVTVTVSPDQVGQVFVYFYDLAAAETQALQPGTYDLIAIDDSVTPPRVAIQRGVELSEDTTLFVDVAADGVAMNQAALDVNLSATNIATWLSTGTPTRARVPAPAPGAVYLFPPALLIETDAQRVSANTAAPAAPEASAGASVEVAGDEAEVSLTLPAGLSAATRTLGASPVVQWTADGAWEHRYWYMMDESFTVLWDALMLPGYAAAVGAGDELAITDPSELPGWQAAWDLGDATSYGWWLSLGRSVDDAMSQSTSWDSAFTARASTRAARFDARRVRLDAHR